MRPCTSKMACLAAWLRYRVPLWKVEALFFDKSDERKGKEREKRNQLFKCFLKHFYVAVKSFKLCASCVSQTYKNIAVNKYPENVENKTRCDKNLRNP